jgi:Putative phage holin Dp-1
MEQDHLISNSTYDLLKRFVTLVLPGLATLYAALAAIWGLPNPEAVVATFAALATFGGVLINFSTKSWNESNAKYDGELITVGYDEDSGLPNLQLNVTSDVNELIKKPTIRLRSIDETEAA